MYKRQALAGEIQQTEAELSKVSDLMAAVVDYEMCIRDSMYTRQKIALLVLLHKKETLLS